MCRQASGFFVSRFLRPAKRGKGQKEKKTHAMSAC
ncbi:hypothetical protein Rmet_6556 [Cupriavidus metallidurans CH34]|uniref:Uncharacterized protein n=1 Tax=Cupriavidus metallidurans (strain ATCC 43123 / DSM 2839 / NBRC 102507 / CH34) TaxID=266264 RepID=D3DXZ2_CUPMC|nr:hypothetical protein Rmet_6556 [Cupriavidus metallidurans CH34]